MKPDYSAMGKLGGAASGKVATAKRLKKWAAYGVDPAVGQRIYDAGYFSCNQKWRRKVAAGQVKVEAP